MLIQAFQENQTPLAHLLQLVHVMKVKQDPRLPYSFKETIHNKLWCEAIDCEYLAPNTCQVWECVPKAEEVEPFPFTWVFRLKLLDEKGLQLFHKARCCIRGDLQDPRLDFDPEGLYAPVASHESICKILALSANENLIVELGDVSNA